MSSAVPREVQQKIVHDLARGHRSIASIAERHRVSVQVVTHLRDVFGPGPNELLISAQELAKPVRPDAPPAPERKPSSPASPAEIEAIVKEANPRTLTGEDRRMVRRWAAAAGLDVSPQGRIARSVIDQWRAAGSPDAVVPVNAEPDVAPEPEPTPAVEVPPKAAAEDDVVDAVILDACVHCGTDTDPREPCTECGKDPLVPDPQLGSAADLIAQVDTEAQSLAVELAEEFVRDLTFAAAHPDLAGEREDVTRALLAFHEQVAFVREQDELIDAASRVLLELAEAGRLDGIDGMRAGVRKAFVAAGVC